MTATAVRLALVALACAVAAPASAQLLQRKDLIPFLDQSELTI
jgi:hypothetical protein